MDIQKLTIALIGHDRTKTEPIKWFQEYIGKLQNHLIVATGTTGRLLIASVNSKNLDVQLV
ncbi:MAG: methylglyoxal synthase [Cellvibrionaceae bacterium]|jgi:methylglyoxal synthase